MIKRFILPSVLMLFGVALIIASSRLLKAEENHHSATSSQPKFIEVSNGHFVRLGTHLEINSDSVGAIANHGFIVGDKGVAIIDPGGSLAMAQHTLAEIARVTNKPVTHVIVTHVHADHSIGLAAFSDQRQSISVLGHANLERSLLASIQLFNEQFITPEDRGRLEHFLAASRISVVENKHTIDLGNRELLLMSFIKAHSNTDVVIFDTRDKVLWAGDLIFEGRLPVIDGSLPGWLSILDTLEKWQVSLVVPGHGSVGNWHRTVTPQKQYLNELLQRTRTSIAQGKSLTQFLQQTWPSDKEKHWQLFKDIHKTNQTRAYVELEWE